MARTAEVGSDTAESTNFRLLSDQPSESEHDQLGYAQTALQLAEAIKHSRASTPFTIGLEGEWGSGKSTLMKCLRHHLDQDPAIETIWFNAWTAEGRSALEGMIKSILQKLDRSVLRRAARRTKLVGMARLTFMLVGGLLGFPRLVDVIWERANADARTRNELRELVSQAVESWLNRYKRDDERLLAVFIDDLDRASGGQVMEVFEAIKVYLDVHGFVFIIGYDASAITHAVAAKRFNGQTSLSRSYLEKIIQITYTLPPPNDEQARCLLNYYTTSSGTEGLFGDVERSLVLGRDQRNPRRMKRFINAFIVAYRVDPEWRDIGAQSLVEVLLLEMHFPEFSNLFRARASANPVEEFLTYRHDWDHLTEHGKAGEATAGALAELERNLPEEYPVLVRNRDFTALVSAIRASPAWPTVKTKLERRVNTLTLTSRDETVLLQGAPTPPTGSADLLWIDDDPLPNQRLVEILEREGWNLTQARDGDTASQLLRNHRFDVVVSDCVRDGARDAGVQEMMAIRDAGLHEGPVIFFTLRITPGLRDQAEALKARVTNRLEELLTFLRQHHPGKPGD